MKKKEPKKKLCRSKLKNFGREFSFSFYAGVTELFCGLIFVVLKMMMTMLMKDRNIREIF
jgi:hypothetical protein